jgi:hypothetical protein
MTLEEAAAHWAADINGWYGLDATTEEVVDAFNKHYLNKEAFDGTSYVEMFFKSKKGGYTKWLDTADREGLADCVEMARGRGPLPTYGSQLRREFSN